MTVVAMLIAAGAIGWVFGKALGKLDQIIENQKALNSMLSDFVLKSRDSNSENPFSMEDEEDSDEDDDSINGLVDNPDEEIDLVKHIMRLSTRRK